MDDHRLILEVQRHRILYDTSNPFYKDNYRKEQAWSEVAAALRADAADCKARWRMLRDSFVKYVKKNSDPSGAAGGAQRDWKYTSSMSFILPFIQNRAPKRRLQPPPDPEADRAGPVPMLDPSPCPGLPAAPSPASDLPLWTAPLEDDRPGVSDSDRDEVYHFALSTVPQMLRLGRRQRRRAKMEILQALDRLEEEEEEQARIRRYFQPPEAELSTGVQRSIAGAQRLPAGVQSSVVQKPPAGVQRSPVEAQRPPAGVQVSAGVSLQPSVKQDSDPALVKEEPEEQLTAVSVKTEESSLLQHRQTEGRQETQGEDLSSEPHFPSETEDQSENSSDTDDDNWEPL